ncbi:MAG: permease [Candidatus Aenigmatarchaeota archaeon]
MNENTRIIRKVILILFIVAVFSLLIYSRIEAYSLVPTLQQSDLSKYMWFEIPIYYLWDYVSHAWICLLFAFVVAGLFYEFVPKTFFTKYMSSKKASGYLIGIIMAPFFTACSCTMVPIFAGLVYGGAGIGPAISFLLMAPAANILTIIVTGELIGWEIALIRIIVSAITAIIAGVFIAKTPWGKSIEKRFKLKESRKSDNIQISNPPLDDRLWSSITFGGFLAKKIIPYFVVGLVAVSYVEAYLPQDLVTTYLTGILGIILASLIGGPLYTPTLVEIALGKTLLTLGMSKAALLSWLMGQPYDIPNMVAVSRIVKWKVVINYALIALAFSIIFGLVYGILIGVI